MGNGGLITRGRVRGGRESVESMEVVRGYFYSKPKSAREQRAVKIIEYD